MSSACILRFLIVLRSVFLCLRPSMPCSSSGARSSCLSSAGCFEGSLLELAGAASSPAGCCAPSSSSSADWPVLIDHCVPCIARSSCMPYHSEDGCLRMVRAVKVPCLVPITCMSDVASLPSHSEAPGGGELVVRSSLGSLHITASPEGKIWPPQSRWRCLTKGVFSVDAFGDEVSMSDPPVDGMICGDRNSLCSQCSCISCDRSMVPLLSLRPLAVRPYFAWHRMCQLLADYIDSVDGCVCRKALSLPSCRQKSPRILTASLSSQPRPCNATVKLRPQTVSTANQHFLKGRLWARSHEEVVNMYLRPLRLELFGPFLAYPEVSVVDASSFHAASAPARWRQMSELMPRSLSRCWFLWPCLGPCAVALPSFASIISSI